MSRIAVSLLSKNFPPGVQWSGAAIQFFAILPNYLLGGMVAGERSGGRPMCYGNDVMSDDFDSSSGQGRQFGGLVAAWIFAIIQGLIICN